VSSPAQRWLFWIQCPRFGGIVFPRHEDTAIAFLAKCASMPWRTACPQGRGGVSPLRPARNGHLADAGADYCKIDLLRGVSQGRSGLALKPLPVSWLRRWSA
jgi:hypothetical protein